MAQSEGQRAREICESARFIGSMWLGKTMDQLTDQECIQKKLLSSKICSCYPGKLI